VTMPGSNLPSFAELYERELVGSLFRPWAEILVERAGIRQQDRVVDVACGTGIVARLAREKHPARVVGIDLSPQMLAVARLLAPDIEWREGSADSLPFQGEDHFDVLFCQQGLQFFADRGGAAREMYRVLAPGGRLLVATWRSLGEAPIFAELQDIAERHVGTITDRRHSFADEGELAKLLEHAGFEAVRVDQLSRSMRFPDGFAFVRLNAMAIVGMSAAGPTLSEEERIRIAGVIAEESRPVLARYLTDHGLVFDIGSNIATARRPG
jgi:ubiquinone/menaquinone biosynthesis C-methylase UbiE